MDARDLLKEQLAFNHNLVNMVLADVTKPIADSVPAGTVPRIAQIAAHLVQDEDYMVHTMILGKPTLFEQQDWSARTGVPNPTGPMQTPEWSAAIDMNPDGFREYTKAVQATIEYTIANLSDEDMAKEIQGPFGKTTALQFFGTLGLFHMAEHLGEIAAIKGVQEMKGLPF